MNLQPGQQFGQYTIARRLGSGTMGVVYEAADTRLGRTVALKLIHDELSREAEFRTRLALEASRAARINSPYVVKVWELGEESGSAFVSLEFVDGSPLRKAAAGLSIEAKLDLAVQLATGLQAAHDVGVVHRDLKPENIVLTRSGEARILDFGLAIVNQGDSVDKSGDIEGTIAYCSPEQLTGGEIAPASDLFSLGIVLYELFTGRRPFEGDYSAAVIYSILYEEPAGPQEENRAIPYWLNDLILALLKKSPADRPADATSIARTINEKRRSEVAPDAGPRGQKRQRTVTVEDLANFSDDSTWDYFCEAFSDDLIGSLTQRTALVVSAEPSKSRPRNIPRRFELYRCDYLVTGSLARWKDSIRLTLIIYADGGQSLVSRSTWTGTADELFTLLSSAADDTAETLAAVSGTAPRVTAEHASPDVTAYDFYMRGRNYYQTNRPEDLRRAEDLYRKALAIDPNLALAHTGLSDLYTFQYMAYYDRRPEKIAAARDEALRALDISPELPEAHRSLGRFYMFTAQYEMAEESFLRSVRYNPKYAVGFRTLAWLKSAEGDLDAALDWAAQALKLAPTDLETLLLISLIHMDRREFTPAVATLKRAIELGPDYGRAYYNLGTVYMRLGVPAPALENFLAAIKYQGDPNAYADAGYACLILGNLVAARHHFEAGVEAGQMPFLCHFFLGITDAQEGRLDSAAAAFEAALQSIRDLDPNGEDTHLQACRAAVLAHTSPSDAAGLLGPLSARDDLTGDDLYCLTRAFAALGDHENADHFLKLALMAHDGPTEKEATLDPLLQRPARLT